MNCGKQSESRDLVLDDYMLEEIAVAEGSLQRRPSLWCNIVALNKTLLRGSRLKL